MVKYIDKGTARQHLIDRLMESAINNVGIKADADEVFRDIAENRLPVWMAEIADADVSEVVRCKDCKHYQFADNRAFGMPVKMCEWFGFEDVDDDDFCSRAERRVNE